MTAQQHGRPLGPRWLPNGATIDEYRTFLTTAVRNPAMVGAATPTSRTVADTVAEIVPTSGSPVVVELGPGTGALSGAIQRRLPEGGRHIGIELSEDLVHHLRRSFPDLEAVHGDARNLRGLLDELHVARADAVVTSIPWSLLAEETRSAILDQCARAMAPDAAFTALVCPPMQFTPGGTGFRRRLRATFDEVLTHVTWRNLPPILHYTCRRPK